MDMTFLNDFMRATHLLGMALGFGIAVLADLLAARAVLRALDDRDIEMLEQLHRLVWMGLVLLWVSGVSLLWLRTGFDLDRFSPKLMTKVGVVLLLTANALAIGRIGLPTMKAHQSWRFGDLPVPQRLQLSALATISMACWVSALTLGVFSQLKPLQWEDGYVIPPSDPGLGVELNETVALQHPYEGDALHLNPANDPL